MSEPHGIISADDKIIIAYYSAGISLLSCTTRKRDSAIKYMAVQLYWNKTYFLFFRKDIVMENTGMNTPEKKAAIVMKGLNLRNRHFVTEPIAINSYQKKFRQVEGDTKLINFASDRMGSISDCFILYAVAVMGFADRNMIKLFLNSLARSNKELSIMSLDDPEALRGRIKTLFNNGMLFQIKYDAEVDASNRSNPDNYIDNVTIYSAPKDTLSFMNSKLGKRVVCDSWLLAKSMQDIVGWCSASYAAVCLAQNNAFTGYGSRVFKARSTGTTFVPCELTFSPEDGKKYAVACTQAFFKKNEKTQTDKDYMEACIYKINVIRNYIDIRGRECDGGAYVVCAVENTQDLSMLIENILSGNYLISMQNGATEQDDIESKKTYMSHIYFTGEGILRARQDKADSCLLRARLDDNANFIDFVSENPPFVDTYYE